MQSPSSSSPSSIQQQSRQASLASLPRWRGECTTGQTAVCRCKTLCRTLKFCAHCHCAAMRALRHFKLRALQNCKTQTAVCPLQNAHCTTSTGKYALRNQKNNKRCTWHTGHSSPRKMYCPSAHMQCRSTVQCSLR